MPTEINYLALLLPSLGAVLAAIITGFAASWVQHRRNVASEKRTWQRERAKRQRDEVRTCLGDYLQARAAMVALVTAWIAQLRAVRQQSEEARDERSRQIMVCIAGLRHRTDALAVLLAERNPIIPVLRSDIDTLYVWSTSTPYEETPDGRWQFSVPLGDDVLNEARRLLASYE